MSLNVNDFPLQNGDLIDNNNQVVNIVDLLGGGTPVSNQTLNKDDFPIHSGLVIGSDNKLYDLAQLISGSGTDVAEVEKIASTEVLFNEKLPIYEVINSQYKTNTLLFVEGIEGYTQTVQLTIDPVQSARISWGDGSEFDFITEETTLTHTYEKEGKYIIKIESPAGRVYVLSGNAIVLTNCNLVKAQFGADCNVRNGLSFPAQNLTDLYTQGQADFNFSIFQYTKLKEFYINNLEGTTNIPNESFRYSTIEKVTISNNAKTFGNYVFPNNIKEIYIETDPSNPHINFNYTNYTFANISEYTPVYIPYGTKEYFETNLPYFKIYIEVVDDVAKELHKKLDNTGDTTNTTFALQRTEGANINLSTTATDPDNAGNINLNSQQEVNINANGVHIEGDEILNISTYAGGQMEIESDDITINSSGTDICFDDLSSVEFKAKTTNNNNTTYTNVLEIDSSSIASSVDITTTNTTFTNTSLVTKQWVLNNSSSDVICTQAEYNALPSSKLTDGISYYITDVNVVGDGNNISW
jgi:hypothetical protein